MRKLNIDQQSSFQSDLSEILLIKLQYPDLIVKVDFLLGIMGIYFILGNILQTDAFLGVDS